jgi:hypothetical protein
MFGQMSVDCFSENFIEICYRALTGYALIIGHHKLLEPVYHTPSKPELIGLLLEKFWQVFTNTGLSKSHPRQLPGLIDFAVFSAKCAKNARKSVKLRAPCELCASILSVSPNLADCKKTLASCA